MGRLFRFSEIHMIIPYMYNDTNDTQYWGNANCVRLLICNTKATGTSAAAEMMMMIMMMMVVVVVVVVVYIN